MPRRKKSDEHLSEPLSRATSPEEREQQLVMLATDLVEKRLREGTASSAEIVHFLKLASSREQLEQEKLRAETEKARAQAKAVADGEDTKKLMGEAISAMLHYRGTPEEDDNGFIE